ncbi:MAG: lyase family protein, partial [Candidatus Dormibacteria bacterium]
MSDFPSPDAPAELRRLTSAGAWVAAMLDFEVGLAEVEAELGLIPQEAAAQIAAGVRAGQFDPERLADAAAESSNSVLALLAEVRGRLPEEAAQWVHFGVTSQDLLDTAAMLVVGRALAGIVSDLEAATARCAELARRHRDTPQLARTLLQPAVPTTFGLRAAGWLLSLLESRASLQALRDDLALQLGGAAGTQAGLGGHGAEVAERLAAKLGLRDPGLPWHTRRDRLARLGCALALLAGACAKLAGDVILLAQPEIGELAEGGPRSGSSAMPGKRNAGRAVMIRAEWQAVPGLAATLISGLAPELDRGAGGWQAEAGSLSR